MAIPSDIGGLRVWYKADAEAYADGDAVGTATDQSGNAYHATQGSASLKPIFRTNRINGKASYDFDGADDALANATGMDTVMGAGAHTYFVVFKPHTIDYTLDGYSRGEGLFGMSTHDFLGLGLDGGVAKLAAEFFTGNVGDPNPEVVKLAVTLNAWHFAVMVWDASADLYLYLDGSVSGSVTAATTTARVTNGGLRLGYNDFTGTACFDGEIAEVFAYNSALSTADRQSMEAYLRAKYLPATAAQTEQVRDAMSRRLWFARRSPTLLETAVPPWLLDADVGDLVYVESPHGPDAAGAGWGPKRWQRRPFVVFGTEPSPESGLVKLTLRDFRPLHALMWDAGFTRQPGHGLKADGVARFGAGGARTFTRASRAWATNPADAGQVVAHADNEPTFSYDGELFEEASTNDITRSSFVSGTTGLTLSGTGTNGSAITADASALLMHPDVSPSSLRFLAGSPHAADLVGAEPATASYTANSVVRVSVDHYDDSGIAFNVRITRSIDGNYWNEATPGWQAGAVTNAMALVSSMAATRWVSKAINVGASGTTITVAVLQPSGGTASRVNHLFHVQCEKLDHASSRIVTDGTAYTRAKARLLLENNTGKRCWSGPQGSFLAEVIADWDSADIGNTNRCIAYAYHDASNSWLVQYNGTSDRFELVVIRGGTTYTAYLAQSVVRGTAYKIAARWTGTEGELDLSTFTASVFVNGTKGTDVGFVSAVTETGTANLETGSKADAENWGGVIRRRLTRPYPLSDAEIGRFEA